MIEKPPRPVVGLPSHISCRGCYVLGSACQRCAKCLKEWETANWDEILDARRANEKLRSLNKPEYKLVLENKISELETENERLRSFLTEIQEEVALSNWDHERACAVYEAIEQALRRDS